LSAFFSSVSTDCLLFIVHFQALHYLQTALVLTSVHPLHGISRLAPD